MKFKKSLYKDFNLRKSYYKLETTRILLKALAFNSILPMSVRQSIFEILHNLSSKSTRIRNRCLYTGRGRGILSEFRMSRIQFRRLADSGLIAGIRRAS
jgi:small subunit ribosomal protein S14